MISEGQAWFLLAVSLGLVFLTGAGLWISGGGTKAGRVRSKVGIFIMAPFFFALACYWLANIAIQIAIFWNSLA